MYDDGNVIEIKYDFIIIVLIYVLIRKLENFWKVLKVYDNIRILEFVCFDDLYVRFYKFVVFLRREMFVKVLFVLEEKMFYEN